MSIEARSLIAGLCCVDMTKRLGNIQGRARTVKEHPWFAKVNWDDIYYRRQPGPIIPHLRGPTDTRNFDEYDPEPANREPYSDDLRARWDDAFKDF